jgi:hypothetical protein
MQQITGVAGGVPYVALPPETAPEGAPLVVAWHLHDRRAARRRWRPRCR